MKTSTTLFALAGLALLKTSSAKTVTVKTCDDLKSAAEMTMTEDTVAIVDSTGFLDCAENAYLTLKIKNNHLTVQGTEVADGVSVNNGVQISNLRFEVSCDGELTWEPKADFRGGGSDVTLVCMCQ